MVTKPSASDYSQVWMKYIRNKKYSFFDQLNSRYRNLNSGIRVAVKNIEPAGRVDSRL